MTDHLFACTLGGGVLLTRMDESVYQKLTARQRDCLRLVARDRDAKEIARILGISPETVVTHLKRATKIIGSGSRFAAARLLADYEGRPHPMVIPGLGGERQGALPDSEKSPASAGTSLTAPVREERATFSHEAVEPTNVKGTDHDPTWLNRLVLMLALTTLIFLILDRTSNLGDAFQAFANFIKPPTH